MRKVLPLLWFALVFAFTFLQTASAQSDPPLLLRFPKSRIFSYVLSCEQFGN